MQPSVLRRRADTLLQNAAYNPKKLVLIHTGITVSSYLLLNIIQYILSLQIAQTGGLQGLELRSILTTIQQTLELGVTIALPFWEMGLLFAALRWANSESSVPGDLLTGFRRFGAVFRLRLLQCVLLVILSIGVFNISYIIFLLTPFADPLITQMEPLLNEIATTGQITEEQLTASFQSFLPLFIFFGALLVAAIILLFYRVRFADFIILEERSALKAILKSVRITKKNCLRIAKLDLSFWWFYLLQLLCIALGYGYLLFPLTDDIPFLLFTACSLLAQGVLLWQFQAKVLTSYGLAYQSLCQSAFPPQLQKKTIDIE